MAYKNIEDQRKAERKWYIKNRQKKLRKNKERKQSLRSWFVKYKQKESCRCIKCGESDFRVLDFHHKTNNKTDCVADLVRNGLSKKNILKEIQKCDILCSNCHRKLHYNTK